MKRLKKHFFPTLSFLIPLVSALFWVALRVNYSGISKFLGADDHQSFLIMNLPVMVCVAAWLGAAAGFAGLFLWPQRKTWSILGLVTGVIMAVGALVVIRFGAKDYLRFILVHFLRSLAVASGLGGFAAVLFFPIRGKRLLKVLLLLAVVAFAVVVGYALRPCEFSVGAVVYAVEDTYQIVFSTSDQAIAWVEIDGARYYDLYAGSMRSKDRVHKITVEQALLDRAGGYTICAKQMIYRGPFGGYTGETISQEYAFRPVNSQDGLSYYALSDVHESVEAAVAAAKVDERTDFVVLIGDLISMIETEKDAQLASDLAHRLTGGELPVIYARGNHEIKGEWAEELYKFVGSKDQGYAYWVTLGEAVFAVVLDMGEDHPDDWWEYYGTAQFTQYQKEQTKLLESILERGAHEPYTYRMAICHIPVVYVDKHGYFEETRVEWTRLLNELGTDICLSGHKHVLLPMLPGHVPPGETLVWSRGYSGTQGKLEGGYLLDFTFPSFLVGRRALVQKGGTLDNREDYTCLLTEVDLAGGTQASCYVNSKGEVLEVVYPFQGSAPEGTVTWIETALKRH